MEKVRPWCGQPSDRGRLKNRTERRLSLSAVTDGPARRNHRKLVSCQLSSPTDNFTGVARNVFSGSKNLGVWGTEAPEAVDFVIIMHRILTTR